jgi:hypothetical protein
VWAARGPLPGPHGPRPLRIGTGVPFPAVPARQRRGRGMVKLITLCVVGIAALAIVGGLFVAVCMASLIAPKDDSS